MGSSRRYRFLFQPVGVPRAIFFPLANVKRLRRRRSSARKAARFQKHVAIERFHSFRKSFAVYFESSVFFVRLVARFAFKIFRDVTQIS